MNLTKFLQSHYLQAAYECVCDVRKYYSESHKKLIFVYEDRPPVLIWNAQDALLLKAFSLFLYEHLNQKIFKSCTQPQKTGLYVDDFETVVSAKWCEGF